MPGNKSDVMPWNSGRSWFKNFGKLTSMMDRNMRMFSFSSGYFSYNHKINTLNKVNTRPGTSATITKINNHKINTRPGISATIKVSKIKTRAFQINKSFQK